MIAKRLKGLWSHANNSVDFSSGSVDAYYIEFGSTLSTTTPHRTRVRKLTTTFAVRYQLNSWILTEKIRRKTKIAQTLLHYSKQFEISLAVCCRWPKLCNTANWMFACRINRFHGCVHRIANTHTGIGKCPTRKKKQSMCWTLLAFAYNNMCYARAPFN